ncbi:MAG: cation:proton antiporter, partial [Candidatus Woesearchaeota archaeon]
MAAVYWMGLWIFLLFIVVGYSTLIFSRTFKLPEPIILFAIGLIARMFVPSIPLVPLLIFALIILVFDAGAHFIPRKFDAHSLLLSDFIILSIAVNSLLTGLLIYFMIYPKISAFTIILSIIIGSMITACSQFEILKSFKIKRNRLYYLTILEDHLSNPIALIIAISGMNLILHLNNSGFTSSLFSTLSALLVDIGTGFFFGLIMLFVIVRLFKRKHIHFITFLFAILTYFISISGNGTGFIAVLILSLFFHNVSTKMPDMNEFSPFISNLVYIITFMLMGYVVELNIMVLLFAVILFGFYLIFRYVMLHFFIKDTHSFLAL